MKKAIKKIAAVAMAFTLLGTGTTIAKTVNPKSVTTLSVHAACNHVADSSAVDKGGKWEFISEEKATGFFNPDRGAYVDTYKKPVKCARCGKLLWYRYKKEYLKWVGYKNKLGWYIDKLEVYKTEYWIGRFLW